MNINISKRNLIVTVCVLFLCMIAYTLVFSLSLNNDFRRLEAKLEQKLEDISKEEQHKEDVQVLYQTEDQSYTLYEHDGKIGIFNNDTNDLLKILDVYVITLPDADKRMLKDGIYAASTRELVSLVEDYTS